MSIPLPPLPESAVKLRGKRGKQLSPEVMSFYTEDELRARDLEVAKAVLEAVAGWIKTQRMVTPANGYEFSSSICTLEFKHHE